jgi:hypothetical protein
LSDLPQVTQDDLLNHDAIIKALFDTDDENGCPLPADMKKPFKENEPGYDRYPLTDWSLTITKTGADVAAQDQEVIHAFFKYYCTRGGVALEVGPRAHNLHFQGVFTTKYPTAPEYQKKMNLFVKHLFTHKVKGHRFNIKPLAPAQTFELMCGYIMKDEGQHWFSYRVYNVSNDLLHKGKMRHQQQLTAVDEGKVVITIRNLYKEMFKFQKRSFDPIVPPMRYTLLYAVQSKYYLPSGDLIKSYSKMHSEEAEALWKICHSPGRTTVQDIDMIFFERRGYDNSRPSRYYIRNASGNTDLYDKKDTPVTPAGATDKEDNSLDSPYDKIEKVLAPSRAVKMSSNERSSSSSSSADPMTSDFIQLPNVTAVAVKPETYFIDKEGASDVRHEEYACPPTIDEMMFIVKSAREGRTDIMQEFEIDAEPQELRERRGTPATHAFIDLDAL